MSGVARVFYEYYIEWHEYYVGWTAVGWLVSIFSLRASIDIAAMLAITTFLLFFSNEAIVEKKGLNVSLVSGLRHGVSCGMAVAAGVPLGLLFRYVKWLTHPVSMRQRGWF